MTEKTYKGECIIHGDIECIEVDNGKGGTKLACKECIKEKIEAANAENKKKGFNSSKMNNQDLGDLFNSIFGKDGFGKGGFGF